jgi:prevent-host-death family protein
MTWQLQKAKNQLSEVVRRARSAGPQVITVHGKTTAVVLSAEDYARLTARKESLVQFFQRSPLAKANLDLSRSRDTGRKVDL